MDVHPVGFLVPMLVLYCWKNTVLFNSNNKKLYLTMFCLTFQALGLQLLWSNRSYTRMMHSHWNLRFISVSNRQNTWTMLLTFSIAIHNDEYCIVLIAIKLNSQWCLLTVEYGRCTATWNLESKYFLARFIKLSYTRHPSSNAWSEAINDDVPALRVQWGYHKCRITVWMHIYAWLVWNCNMKSSLQYLQHPVVRGQVWQSHTLARSEGLESSLYTAAKLIWAKRVNIFMDAK